MTDRHPPHKKAVKAKVKPASDQAALGEGFGALNLDEQLMATLMELGYE